MNREKIIAAIASASNLHHREGRDIFANKMYSLIESGKIEGVMLKTAEMDQLIKENESMRKAIAFAISPGIWIQREEDIYQYRGNIWYADVLKGSLKIGGDNVQ